MARAAVLSLGVAGAGAQSIRAAVPSGQLSQGLQMAAFEHGVAAVIGAVDPCAAAAQSAHRVRLRSSSCEAKAPL